MALRNPNFSLKEGESLDDLCLIVEFEEEPPLDLSLPSEYQGVRVSYTTIGKFESTSGTN